VSLVLKVFLVLLVWTGLSALLGLLVAWACQAHLEPPDQPDSEEPKAYRDYRGNLVPMDQWDRWANRAVSDHLDQWANPVHPVRHRRG
jgi:hypothetical protein